MLGPHFSTACRFDFNYINQRGLFLVLTANTYHCAKNCSKCPESKIGVGSGTPRPNRNSQALGGDQWAEAKIAIGRALVFDSTCVAWSEKVKSHLSTHDFECGGRMDAWHAGLDMWLSQPAILATCRHHAAQATPSTTNR